MLGIAILIGFNLLGIIIEQGLQIPMPGNVIGLILFTLCLFFKIIKLEWVEDAAQFLLKHMMFFFTPLVVSTVVFFPLLSQYWVSVVISVVVSTCIVLLVTGWVTEWLGGGEVK